MIFTFNTDNNVKVDGKLVPNAVPEPASVAMVSVGLGAVMMMAVRRRKSA